MKRRSVALASLALGIACPLLAMAQPQKIFRIGVLSHYIPRDKFVLLPAVLRGLGYVEGKNLVFEYRFADAREERLAGLARDLVAAKVDLILAVSNAETIAAKDVTSTIPIVMIYGLAPVESGLVASLAHPGGNVTGTTVDDPEGAGKKLEILREAVPGAANVVLLWEPDYPGMKAYGLATERAAKAMGIQLTLAPVRTLDELEAALILIARERPDALYVAATGAIFANRVRVIAFAARQRLPAVYSNKGSVVDGGLMSYLANQQTLTSRTAAIVDRILRGARPADIPVEQPTKYELVINLKTAKALGITLPQTLLMRADEVIEQ